MKKVFLFFILLVSVLHPEEIVKIKDLYKNEDMYNSKVVIIEGEAIGEKIGKGEDIWINLKDEDYLIGVFTNENIANKIENFGRYRVKGDIVRVKGIYNKFCEKHYGERDIHALEIEVILKGEKYPEEVSLNKIIISFIMLLITIFIILYYHKISPIK